METIIIKSLFDNNQYTKRVLPFLKPDYFEADENKLILQAFHSYAKKYKTYPTYSVIKTGIIQNVRLSENLVKTTFDYLEKLEHEKTETFDSDWLFDQAESYCQQHALESAIIESSSIIGDPDRPNGEIGDIIKKALQVSFDTNLGLDLFSKLDMKACYDAYVLPENKIECHLKELNEVFYLLKRTCTSILASVGTGKTNALCSLSIGYVKKGYNVVYVSGEMADIQIARILYANLMTVTRNDIPSMKEMEFMSNHKTFKLKSASWGRYFVKEYPPATVNMDIIEAYIQDLELKKNIKIDIIALDYLNLFLPRNSRASDNTYTAIKRVSEEFRALCVGNDLAGITATQTNRDGAKTTDLDMTDTSESFGLPATMDAMIGIISSDDLRKQNIQIWKIIKNRMTGVIDYKIPFQTQFEYGRIVDMADKSDVPIDINNSPTSLNMAKKLKRSKENSGIPIFLDNEQKDELENLLNDEKE